MLKCGGLICVLWMTSIVSKRDKRNDSFRQKAVVSFGLFTILSSLQGVLGFFQILAEVKFPIENG